MLNSLGYNDLDLMSGYWGVGSVKLHAIFSLQFLVQSNQNIIYLAQDKVKCTQVSVTFSAI